MIIRGPLIFVFLFMAGFSQASGEEYRVVRSFPIAAEPACMPALTRAPNGDLLVAFSTEWEPFPEGGTLKLVVSQDQGITWSRPRVLWKHDDPRVTIQVSNGMQTLSNGEILLPVTLGLILRRKNASPEDKNPLHGYDMKLPGYRREVRLLRSQDNGKTWTISDPKLENPWWRFGRLFETADGRLIMPGEGWYIESKDFGRTWGRKVPRAHSVCSGRRGSDRRKPGLQKEGSKFILHAVCQR